MKKPCFCPNPHCTLSLSSHSTSHWFIKIGTYPTHTFGRVQRFQCKLCGKKFSSQTFHINYYAKKKVNYHCLFNQLKSKSGIRDMARDLNVSTSTIQNRVYRLSRNALFIHQTLKTFAFRPEDLCADGLESFCVSQYFPDNIHLLVGKDSQFVYFTDYVTLRRKGRMTPAQKLKRRHLETRFKPDPRGIQRSFFRLLDQIPAFKSQTAQSQIRLFTDEKKDYQRAARQHPLISRWKKQGLFRHIRISSRLIRDHRNPLFSVNYMEREIRKDLANHVRETVQFSRNVNDGLSRLIIYLVYHNYFKPYRIKRRTSYSTHARAAGIMEYLVNRFKSGFFSSRVFVRHCVMDETAKKFWYRLFKTPLKQSTEAIPQYVAT